MKDQFCWCQQKLSILRKCPNFCPKVLFFFNYIAINDNKLPNLQLITQGLLTTPLTEHSILQFSLSSANINQYLISEKKEAFNKISLKYQRKWFIFSKAKTLDMYIGLL